MKLNTKTREATGNIDELIKHYVSRAGWFDDLHSNMKLRIKELELTNNEEATNVAEELKTQLKMVNAWWDTSMEDTSRLHSQDTCFYLRKYSGDKLGR